MNQTKINDIAEFCESLTHDELKELCKKLIAENEGLIAENKDLKLINFIFSLANGISKVVIERK